MKTYLLQLLTVVCLLLPAQMHAFCGFYVAKADAKLFNKSSKVIVVRDGDHNVVTMNSDFEGDVKDFAMVVPVPVVLKKSDIRVVEKFIFDKIDAYTAPRLVEYWDESPCRGRDYISSMSLASMTAEKLAVSRRRRKQGVKIEAKYTVGEYDILILSAKKSSGLKEWLVENGYKIPEGAEEVLDPYIQEGMKFFVVKVNVEEQKRLGKETLRPIQIQYNASRYMLPIRLGMANAAGPQDMIVYAFTKKGRVESSNYRTVKLPTNVGIPEFILSEGLFGDFYKSLFERVWAQEGRNSVVLEYAWDVSGTQSVKCDPCPTPPINLAEMREAGVWWLEPTGWNDSYLGDCFVTRLHVRYDRSTFPQDLLFVNTSDQSSFQGRYVVRHSYQGKLDCDEARGYREGVRLRRKEELKALGELTGWDVSKYSYYLGSVEGPAPVVPGLPGLELEGGRMRGYGLVPGYRVGIGGFLQRDDSVQVALAAVESEDGLYGRLQDEASSLEKGEAFLKAGLAGGSPRMGTKAWLVSIAVLMLALGVAVRMRRSGAVPKSPQHD